MAVATWEDVAVALGRLSSDVNALQHAQWGYWLNGAEIVIRSRLGDPALLDQDVLRYVETEVVAEKVRSTRTDTSTSSVTVTADDGAVTRRYESPPVSAADFTDSWWGLLSPVTAVTAYSAAVVSPIDMPRDVS